MRRRGLRLPRFFTDSVLVKSLTVLFSTMVLACLLTYIVMFLVLGEKMEKTSIRLVQQRAEYLMQINTHTDLGLEELVGLYRMNIGHMGLYESFSDLPPLRGVIVESDMREGTLYFSAERDLPYGVLKLDGRYVVIPPYIYEWESDLFKRVVIHTLLLCAAIASVCTVLNVSRMLRPMRRLDKAIARLGHGDFDAHVEYKSQDEMGKIVDNFNRMTRELGRMEYLRRDFVSSVSHEFKTPIAAIQGSAKLLGSLSREKLTDEKMQKYTGLILEEAGRMSNLASNLLRLSRLENQSTAENITRFSLDEQIRHAILQLENQWKGKGLEMVVQCAPAVYEGDEELLMQVWTNLLTNAVKFTGTGGTITVRLAQPQPNAGVEIEIADTGIGMDKETMDRLFEKFYQGDPSHRVEGNGLGLSIVKRIVDLHQGNLVYTSEPGKGTVCRVYLPRRL